MLMTPICFLVSLYAAFVYGECLSLVYDPILTRPGLLYANLGGFTIVFQEIRGWGPVTGNLPFLALLVGILAAAVVNVFNNKYYFRRFTENGNKAVPEARLPPMMIGGIMFSGGLFLFGCELCQPILWSYLTWPGTSSPTVNFWPSIVGIGLTGFGFTTIFQAAINYIVDTFTRYAASAIAAATLLRSIFACAFLLFIGPLYHRIGVNWGTTVLACTAALLVPVPFIFFFYGREIRAKNEWSRFSV